jgi:hypothetical protein
MLVAHWLPIAGLQSWMFTLRFGEKKLLGCCAADAKYETAVMGFNLARIRKELPTPVAVEELVVHEIGHALLPRGNETEVTRVSRAMLRAAGRNPSIVCSCR